MLATGEADDLLLQSKLQAASRQHLVPLRQCVLRFTEDGFGFGLDVSVSATDWIGKE
jgi:hypothetical protein